MVRGDSSKSGRETHLPLGDERNCRNIPLTPSWFLTPTVVNYLCETNTLS